MGLSMEHRGTKAMNGGNMKFNYDKEVNERWKLI